MLFNEERRVNILAKQQAEDLARSLMEKQKNAAGKLAVRLKRAERDLKEKSKELEDAQAMIRTLTAANDEWAAATAKHEAEARRAQAELKTQNELMQTEKDYQAHHWQSSAHMPLPASIAPVIERALSTAIDAAIASAAAEGDAGASEPASWSLASFLGADDELLHAICHSLSRPLRERLDERRLPFPEAVGRTFLKEIYKGGEEAFGGGGGQRTLAALLLDSPLVEVLADRVSDKARLLLNVKPPTAARGVSFAGPSEAHIAPSKLAELAKPSGLLGR